MFSACRAAGLQTVLASRRFVEIGKLEELITAIEVVAREVYFKDIRDGVSSVDKLTGLLARPFAGWLHRRLGVKASEPAAVLFASGSEGTPMGMVLLNGNLLANRCQFAVWVDFYTSDIAPNALPVFHSFGLTGGLILPLLSGVQTFLYPSPRHHLIVPALVYDSNMTILFGTDTFLTGYARMGHAYDFFNVQGVFAGVEKVTDETRRVGVDKLGLRILNGYGATETGRVPAGLWGVTGPRSRRLLA
ncbi:MAG: AMP-binding protein [Alphaproteobacteria bacterium]|nr:AMP-binding protein [Alphaproteobacteria bacterium]